jgi:capsular polysaccharide biosynthesis protein
MPHAPGQTAPLAIIPDLQAETAGRRLYRHRIAGVASTTRNSILIDSTERFFVPGLVEMHKNHGLMGSQDLACYFARDAVVTGAGQIWLDDRLITSPEIVPGYVVKMLDLEAGGSPQLRAAATLPIRTIESPCVIAVGHGIRVYGHFLVEMLFRILTSRYAMQASFSDFKILLSLAAPAWLLAILTENLRIRPMDIEFFNPKVERVIVRDAIIPTIIHADERFHPFANDLLADVIASMKIPTQPIRKRRLFIKRGRYHNPKSPHRICTNENELVDIAVSRHGFQAVTPESMSWREQIGLFSQAEIILGQAGSGLHNALFAGPGTRLASIGFLNMMQSGIAALRGHHAAFLTDGFQLAGDFEVSPNLFGEFLDIACQDH